MARDAIKAEPKSREQGAAGAGKGAVQKGVPHGRDQRQHEQATGSERKDPKDDQRSR